MTPAIPVLSSRGARTLHDAVKHSPTSTPHTPLTPRSQVLAPADSAERAGDLLAQLRALRRRELGGALVRERSHGHWGDSAYVRTMYDCGGDL